MRRSNRIQKKKTIQYTNCASPKAPIIQVEKIDCQKPNVIVDIKKSVQTVKIVKEEICVACKKESPPLRRYSKTEWIQCDICEEWWHLECASLDRRSAKTIIETEVQFPCAFCVLKNSPWIQIQAQSKSQQECSKPLSEVAKAERAADSIVTDQKLDSPRKKLQSQSHKDQIVIFDNIDKEHRFISSTEIEKKLKDKGIEEVQRAYTLPQGGITVEFKNSTAAKACLNTQKLETFGKEEKVHTPKGAEGITTGFVKNIDPRISEQDIHKVLIESGCKVTSVRRLRHRGTGQCMPVVKIFHDNRVDLEISTSTNIPLSFKGKKAYVEKQRRIKVVRCYNCMLFGHIAANCDIKAKCENCGGEECKSSCTNDTKCANCTGNHKASSSKCPVYQKKISELQKKSIL